jgi:hypothetical protein
LAEAVRELNAVKASHYEAQTLVVLAGFSEPEAARQCLARALEIYEAGGSPLTVEVRRRLEAL